MCCQPEWHGTNLTYLVSNNAAAVAAPAPQVIWWPDPTAAAPTVVQIAGPLAGAAGGAPMQVVYAGYGAKDER